MLFKQWSGLLLARMAAQPNGESSQVCRTPQSAPLGPPFSPEVAWHQESIPQQAGASHQAGRKERPSFKRGTNAMETVFPSCGDGLSIFLLPATLPHFTQSHDASPCFPVRVHPRVPKSSRPQVLMSWRLTPTTTSWKLFPGGLSRLNLSLSS